MIERPECDCEVVDDPEMVCPKHQAKLFEYLGKLEAVARAADRFISQDRQKSTVGEMVRVDLDLAVALAALNSERRA